MLRTPDRLRLPRELRNDPAAQGGAFLSYRYRPLKPLKPLPVLLPVAQVVL